MVKTLRNWIKKISIKNSLIALGLAVFLFFSILFPAGVLYAQSLDDMVPEDGNTTAIYNKYGVSNYSFQTITKDRHFWEVGAKTQDGIVRVYDHILSMGFLASVQITRFFNYVAREAFTFSFMNDLIDAAADIIKSITGVRGGSIVSGGFWDSMGGMLVMITVAYILWLMVRTRFLEGLSQSLSFVIALVICLGFFSQSGTILKGLNNFGNDVGTVMYTAMAKATGLNSNSTDGVTVISEQVWRELVIRPYAMLQYDDPNADTKDPALFDKVLKTTPFSDEREAALKEAISKYPSISRERPAEQMIVLLCNLIFGLIILGLLSFWACATIFMRLKLLIHAVVMSVTLLASLLPGRDAGINVLRGQFIKLIGLSTVTVFTMFFLDLSLVMGHLTFDIVAVKAGKGWFTGMVLEAIMIIVIFKYRTEIGQVFSKATGVIPPMPKAKSTIVDALQRNATRTLYSSAMSKVGGVFNRKEPEGVPSTFSPSSINKADSNLNAATSSSMTLRYQREKQAAESIASETGDSVQYTPYVQKVNENLRNGTKNPFRGMDKEWKEEKSRLKDVKDDGGNVKQAILSQGVREGMNDQEVASVMYSNENAIRQGSTFMVQRPKRAVDQMERAQSLNRNRKLQTSVDDFCMIQLFDRYKIDHKQAVQTSNATGDPIKHTDLVTRMNERFKESGLNTTQKINDTMVVRSGRLSIASKFEGMKEFDNYKMKLLHANDALRKIAPPTEGVTIPAPKVKITAPASATSILKNIPPLSINPLSNQEVQQRSSLLLNVKQTVEPAVDMKKVTINNAELKKKMDVASSNLGKTLNADHLRLEVDTHTKQKVAIDVRQKISNEVSGGLEDELKHLKTMQRSRVVANVNKSTEMISQNVQSKAIPARLTPNKQIHVND